MPRLSDRDPRYPAESRDETRSPPDDLADDLEREIAAEKKDEPSIPRGRNPDSAMCEDRDRPGQIDKSNDC